MHSPEGPSTWLDDGSKECRPNKAVRGLLKLPVEVRFLIYEYFFGSSETVIHGSAPVLQGQNSLRGFLEFRKSKGNFGCVSLLRTCKTINAEAKRIFLEKTEFILTESSLPNPERDFPLAVRQVSYMTIRSSDRRYLSALRASLINHNCKIPHLTLCGMYIGETLCPFLEGPLSACCSKTLTRYVRFSLLFATYEECQQNPSECAVLAFVNTQDSWVCTNMRTFIPIDKGVSFYLHMIACSAGEREWLQTAEIEVLITGQVPHGSYRVKLVKEDQMTGKMLPLKGGGPQVYCGADGASHQIVRLE